MKIAAAGVSLASAHALPGATVFWLLIAMTTAGSTTAWNFLARLNNDNNGWLDGNDPLAILAQKNVGAFYSGRWKPRLP